MSTPRKVVFLDRDGVINVDPGRYSYRVENIDIVEGIVEALKELKQRGYEFVVITNQGGIAKRIYSHKEVKAIHSFLKAFFADHGISILDFYYCPHHDDYGKCLCRKPGSLLLEKAIARYQVDKTASYFVGDKERDIQAGEAAGVTGVLIDVNSDLRVYLNQIK